MTAVDATHAMEVCVIGAGPRGLSVIERLCANTRRSGSAVPMLIHVVDPQAPGAGAVWRTDQSRHLLMNTVASQISVFTDESVRIEGPIERGPTLHEWAQQLALLGDTGTGSEHDEPTRREAAGLGPDGYPTRAFYGAYLRDCFTRIVERAPANVEIRVHRARAVAMADTHGIPGGPQGIRLDNGVRLDHLDAIVMAQGHVGARLSPQEARAASLARIHHLSYFPPGNPADLPVSGIEAGENVLLRGLGLNFFDHMALLTAGRGGEYVRKCDRLRYLPSGREPRLYAFSRRGVPYHARGENEKGAIGRYFPRLLTKDYIAGLRRRRQAGAAITFNADLWPLIAREVESVYYATLLTTLGRDDERERFVERYLGLAPDADPGALLDGYGIDEDRRWSWEELARPCADRVFADRAQFNAWLLDRLARDVDAARCGNVSGPLKAALDVLRDLRNEVRLAVDHQGLDGDSYRDELEGWYTPLNAFLSIGPPASRIEEMAALIEAEVLTVLGPGTQVLVDPEGGSFVAGSGVVPGTPVRARVLIEARLPEPDIRRTHDPLLRHLLDTEQAAPYLIQSRDGGWYQTGGLAVTERPYQLLDARGRAHPRRFAYGVPTESVHWVTAAGIRPGVDSVTLGDSDSIACAVLALPPVAHVPAAVRPMATDTRLTGVVV